MSTDTVKVLFVCMGNICRSPTAEGVFTYLAREQGVADRLHIDSAGTHAYHIGEMPDPRSQTAARNRGVELRHLRARKVVAEDFTVFDYVLAMDRSNYADLQAMCPPELQRKIHLFMDYAPKFKQLKIDEVPDPYYGGKLGFEHVLDLVEAASHGLLSEIKQRLAAEEGSAQ